MRAAYRTAPTEALFVLAGMPPTQLAMMGGLQLLSSMDRKKGRIACTVRKTTHSILTGMRALKNNVLKLTSRNGEFWTDYSWNQESGRK